jgi:cation diffusion facilitator CzcD-associated flavoprotein CzcO
VHVPTGGVAADTAVAIIGTGFGGIGAAVRLKQADEHDFVLLERAQEVGGTWWANTYPGCRCDVPSHLYSFSFAPNPDWRDTYSTQPDIQAYLRQVAEDHGVLPHIRFGADVRALGWLEEAQCWRIETAAGDTLTARAVIAAPGSLSEPRLPDIPGLETFAGTTFHSARWDHDHDLTGERVAVIGTGASAIQFVPQIQPRVGRLDLYQRTPPWIARHTNRPVTGLEGRLYRTFPPAQKLVRGLTYALREGLVPALRGNRVAQCVIETAAKTHLRRQVADPELRARLTPNYRMGCKRILVSNDFYPAVAQPNVELITSGIREVRPHAIVDAAGVEREADTIIFGTGFQVADFPAGELIRGRGGRRLSEAWATSAQAHKGTTVAGFPNLFVITGPNTGLGHSSMVYVIESQLAYIVDALREMRRRGAAAVDVRPDAQARWNAAVQERMQGTVWLTGGCASWYLDAEGRNVTLWPDHTWRLRRELRRFDVSAYELEPPRVPPPASVPEAEPAAARNGALSR